MEISTLGYTAVNHLARATPWLHLPLTLFAEYGVVLFGVLLVAGWWRARTGGSPRTVAASLWAGAATLLAVAVNQPVASAVAEPRPFTVFPHALVLVHRSTDFSFPSDHAVMAGAVAAGLLLVERRLGLVAAALAVLMAFTRVYVGVHVPVDVVAGLALGGLVAVVGWLLVGRLLERLVVALTHTPLRPLLASRPATPVAGRERQPVA